MGSGVDEMMQGYNSTFTDFPDRSGELTEAMGNGQMWPRNTRRGAIN